MAIDRLSDLPVKAKGIYQSSQSPAMFFTHGEHRLRTCFQCFREYRIGVWNGQNHSYRIAAKRFFIRLLITGRLVAEPEFGAGNGESYDQPAIRSFEPVGFNSSKCRFIKVNCPGTVFDR